MDDKGQHAEEELLLQEAMQSMLWPPLSLNNIMPKKQTIAVTPLAHTPVAIHLPHERERQTRANLPSENNMLVYIMTKKTQSKLATSTKMVSRILFEV